MDNPEPAVAPYPPFVRGAITCVAAVVAWVICVVVFS